MKPLSKRQRSLSGLLFGAAALATVTWSQSADAASLGDDAARVAEQWQREHATVVRLAPVFLEERRAAAFPIAHGPSDGGCTTIAVLTARTVGTLVTPLRDKSLAEPLWVLEDDERVLNSDAGLTELRRCGDERSELNALLVEMETARGTVEVVVAQSVVPLISGLEILPEREPGPMAPRGNPGRPPVPASLDNRLDAAEAKSRTRGADLVVRIPMVASERGAGEFVVKLPEGCHQLAVFGDAEGGPVDIDAEAREEESGILLERDRGDAVDAELDVCLGKEDRLRITYVGAAGPSEVVLLSSTWRLAKWLPTEWGSRARAGFATAVRRRNTPTPTEPPMLRSLGVQGRTRIPIEVQPGHCYMAATAVIRGETAGLRLRANIDGRSVFEELSGRPEGLAIVFCSELSDSAMIEVETRGVAPWWVTTVWPLGKPTP